MRVKDVMTSHIACIQPEHTVMEAAKAMQKHNIGILPVCYESQALVGIVTDRDIVTRCIANGRNVSTTPIGDIMTEEVFTIEPDANINEASRMMADYRIRRLPVMHNGEMIGIISIGDIATADGMENKARHALSNISEPSKPMNMGQQ